MSVQSSSSRTQFVGNNSTVTAYVIPWYFQDSGDVVVVITDADGVETTLTETTDYVVSGEGDENGGSIVTVAAWDNTHTITIYREVDATQLTSYIENDAFPASTHETALDKLTFLVQQTLRGIARCFRVTEASQQPDPASSVALAVVGTDSDGHLVFRTVDEMLSFLSLSGAISGFPGATWADDGERAVKVPDYLGQVGGQRDTAAIYISTGTSAGNWTAVVPAAGSLLNAHVSASAAIAFSKLAALASGNILVGNGSNVAASVAMSGDATLANTGALTIANNAVTTAKILDANVTGAKLASGAAAANSATGAVLQTVTAEYATYATNTTVIPWDDTIPQNTEGTEIISLSITPSSASSKVRISLVASAVSSNAGGITLAVFRSGIASAVAASTSVPTSSSYAHSMQVLYTDSPASASAVTYTVRIGVENTYIWYLNGTSAGRKLGGSIYTTLVLEEIKA